MLQNPTPDQIAEYVDKEGALARVRGNATIYKKMLGMLLNSAEFAAFEDAMAAGDLARAGEVAHGIKGMTGNLSLPRLFESSTRLMTELREGKADPDLLARYREDVENTRVCIEAVLAEIG